MSWFVYVTWVGVDEPTPERQSAVRDHVMRRFQEAGVGCRPYFTPLHLQPFYRAGFGFKEGDFSVTELAASAHPARLAGHTSIAIPFHQVCCPDRASLSNRTQKRGRPGDADGRTESLHNH